MTGALTRSVFCGLCLLAAGCANTMNSGTNISAPQMAGVLLDPGHGGTPEETAGQRGLRYASLGKRDKRGLSEECYGAIAENGYMEKTAALAVARKVGALLEQQGVPSSLTRMGDSYLTLDERSAMAQDPRHRDWIFVSIHFNRSSRRQRAVNLKASQRAPEGFEIYILPREGGRSSQGRRASARCQTVNRTRDANRMLAESIASEMAKIPGVTNRGIKTAWFVVLRGSPLPSILVEGGFMSNPEEARLIASDDHQWKLARAIARGILNYRLKTNEMTCALATLPH